MALKNLFWLDRQNSAASFKGYLIAAIHNFALEIAKVSDSFMVTGVTLVNAMHVLFP